MRLWWLAPLLSLLVPSLTAASDYHYTIRHTWNGPPYEQTHWVSGDKRRIEYRHVHGNAKGTYGPRIATIMDCATRQGIQLNLDDREYATDKLPTGPTGAEIKQSQEKAKMPKSTIKGEPSITIESNTVETAERKTFFGHEARHFITTRKIISHREPDLADEQVIDGWYFDFYPKTGCEPEVIDRRGNFVAVLTLAVPAGQFEGGGPEYDIKRSGPELPGMSVKQTMRFRQSFRMPDGSLKKTTDFSETEIVDFSEGPLDPALFQVPTGFKRVVRINDPLPTPPMDFSARVQYWWERMKYDLSQIFH